MIEEVLCRDTDTQTFDISGERFRVIRNGSGSRGGVLRVRTGDDLEQTRDVGNRLGHRPDVVERPTERGHAVAADPAICRLQAYNAATFGRITNGAAAVASNR